MPNDRAAAAVLLDERLGDWRPLLDRFASDRAPVYFRPHADTGAVLRRLQAARVLAELALAHVGAARRVATVGTLDEVLRELGDGAVIIRSRAELKAAAE